jgi:hypothetical protein
MLSRLFADRLTGGLTLLLGALVIGTALRATGAPTAPIYWGMFVASMAGTLLALSVGSPVSLLIGRSDAHGASLRRVLVLEQDRGFVERFAKALRSYGAEIETVDVSEVSRSTRISTDHDVVIADGNLPYGLLLQIKATVDTRRQVFIIVRLPDPYPLSPPGASLVEILEAAGPPQMRREIEDVLGAMTPSAAAP